MFPVFGPFFWLFRWVVSLAKLQSTINQRYTGHSGNLAKVEEHASVDRRCSDWYAGTYVLSPRGFVHAEVNSVPLIASE